MDIQSARAMAAQLRQQAADLEASARTLHQIAFSLEHQNAPAETWRVRFIDGPARIEAIKACRAACEIPLKDAREAVLSGHVFDVEPCRLQYYAGLYEVLREVVPGEGAQP